MFLLSLFAVCSALTTVTFLRHGQARNNIEKRLVGRMPEVSLTANGWRQAEYAAQAVSKMNIARIYSSPLERTLQTARTVANHNNIPMEEDIRLTEIEMGNFTGMTYDAMLSRWGNVFLRFYQNDPMLIEQGVESFRSVQCRVQEMIDFVLGSHPGQNILLVTHMDPVKAMLSLVLDLTPEKLQEIVIANGSLNVFHVTNGSLSLGTINMMDPGRLSDVW